MGKWERKQWDSSILTSRVFGGLSVVFLLGALVGCIFTAFAEENGVVELGQYLSQYFELLKRNEIEVSFGRVLWSQGRYFLYVVLFSLSVIGVGMIPMLVGIRGFLIAFSYASCYRMFGMSGLWVALVLFGIPAFFWYPGFLLLSAQGFFGSLSMIRRGESDSEKSFSRRFPTWRQMIYGMIFLAIAVIVEYRIVPIAIGWILRMM